MRRRARSRRSTWPAARFHNDAAEIVVERFASRVEIDHDTARRLFTLICVLHIRQ